MGSRPSASSGLRRQATKDDLLEANRRSRATGFRRGQDAGGSNAGRAPSTFLTEVINDRLKAEKAAAKRTAATASQAEPVDPNAPRSSQLDIGSDSPVRASRRDRRRGTLLGRFATTANKTLLGA